MAIKLSKKAKEALRQSDREIAMILKGVIPKGVRVETWPMPFSPAWIKELRKRNKMRQKDLSECVHESLGAVRHWEQGLRKPRGAAAALLRLLWMRPEMAVTLKAL